LTGGQAGGLPRAIPLFPSGEARIELRGTDEVTDDSGKPCKLERYALTGRSWGRETFWIDEDADASAKAKGRLAAFKAVDAEFDHFEASGRGYSDAIGKLVASSAADGVAALREQSRSALAEPVSAVPVAYVGATLLDGTGGPAVPDSVVVVDRGRIAAAGARDRVEIPAGARRIEAAGKTIVPGLWDMHAHFEQVEWGPVYLAAGVTTVRDCGNELDFVRAVRDTIDAGKGLGPRILLACIVDGEGPASVGTVRLRDEKGIPDLIRKFQDARCSQVKIYSSLDPRLITPLSKAAHEAGMSVTGHIPNGIGAVRAVEAGMDQINHIGYVLRAILPVPDPEERLSNASWARALDELDVRSDRVRSIVASFARRGVVVDPTLALFELGSATRATLESREPGLAKIAPQLKEALDTGVTPEQEAQAGKAMRARLDTVRALHEGGVTIVAGTDQAVPGHSLHREMELYVSAGFTPMEALQAATIVPARVMNREKDLGTVETGKIADFLVVDGDPLADIRNLRRIALVVQAGRAYDPTPLWKMAGFQP
jgi:imidazolonepropionase-like amidohydrolase